MKPGKTTDVRIHLRNMAQTLIKDVKVTIGLDGIPIAPIGSTNIKMLDIIEPVSDSVVSFTLMPEPDAASKLYKVPIKMEFSDRSGTTYLRNETIGLIIGAKPDLIAEIDSSSARMKGQTGDVTIRFVNKGVTPIKFLYAHLEDTEYYDILSAKESYVGNIDSDDYETTDFKITLKDSNGEEVILPLSIDYKDANNNNYADRVELPLRLYTASEAKALGITQGSSFTGIFIVIVIVAAGFFIYRRWRRKQGKDIRLPFFRKR